MKSLEAKIQQLRKLQNREYLKKVWQESLMVMEQTILDLLEQQHEASEDGDGNPMGTYSPLTKMYKELKGTWRGWDIKLIDDADPYGKHWREMWFIRFEGDDAVVDEDKVWSEGGGYLLIDYLTGRNNLWGKGKESFMHFNQEHKDWIVEATKTIMKGKLNVL